MLRCFYFPSRLHRACLGIFLSFFVVSPAFAATSSTDAGTFSPLSNEFAAAIVMTPGTHQVLYSFKPDKKWPAASLTKLSNALAFVKLAPSWDRVATLKTVDEVGGGRLRVKNGARVTLRDLLFSSITGSANNAATALSRLSGLSRTAFLKRMNTEAKKAGARYSIFVDASGMDDRNITTARDIALIAETAFQQPLIRSAATTAQYTVSLVNRKEIHTIKNTNQLLTKDDEVWVIGGKTGYLESSKYNLVVQLRPVDAEGQPIHQKELIITVLGAPTKEGSFNAAKRLASWAWNNHEF